MASLIGNTISHYKVLEKLGEGGMGVVYRAEDLKLKRQVALKVLTESVMQEAESRRRFLMEAQNASSLQHNNICTIHEVDEVPDGSLFIAMDYYTGQTLRARIADGPLEVFEILDVAGQIAAGLHKAHESKIIHRDIKPANIFLTTDGTVKILDFGLAKRVDRTELTRGPARFGTTEYMSPEQIKGEAVDARTDIWSWGIVLYEMMTGEPPFQADYDQALIYLIMDQDVEDVRKFRTDIPAKLLSILDKAIAKEREDRFEDFAAVRDALKDVERPVEAEAPRLQLTPPAPSRSIAVLPFLSMSANTDLEYFCDGLTEELINTLSRIRDLKVVARTSAFAFKGGAVDVRKVGRKLDVSTILEGSVRKAGEKLRITAQLINVADGYHLWSERYEREAKDLFGIQDEISLAIVDVLKVKLMGEERVRLLKRYTENVEAYNLYVRGYYFFNQLNLSLLNKATEYFRRALELDPNYAVAYYGLGGCYFCLAYFGVKRSGEVKEEMLHCIRRGLEIDPNVGELYELLALYKACFEWNWSESLRAGLRALELNPSNVMTLLNAATNRVTWKDFNFAKDLVKRAQSLDPLFDYGEFCAALPDFCTGNFLPVIERLSKYLKLDPPFWWGLWMLWRALSLSGRRAEAVDACKKAFSVVGSAALVQVMESAGIDGAFETAARAMEGYYHRQYCSPYDIATLFIHARMPDEAFRWLDQAFDDWDIKLHWLNVDPDWREMRKDPRFTGYLQRMGFIP